MKTLSISTVVLLNQSETHLYASHNSLIDFLEDFNLKSFPIDRILEKNFNSQDFVCSKVLAFNAKVMEIYESTAFDQDLNLPQEEQSQIQPILLPVEIVADEMYLNQDTDNIIDCLTLKVSSQPWIFSPDHNISCRALSIKPDHIQNIFDTDVKLNNKTDIDQEDLLKIEGESNQLHLVKDFDQDTTQVSKIDSYSTDYITHECTRCDFSFSPEVNIKKYEALSNAIHGQIYKQVTLHNFMESDTLEIELYPEKLGKIKIKCNIDNDDKMILQVSADKLTTLGLLQQNVIELQDIIARNLHDSSHNKTELSFTMSDNSSNHRNSQDHYPQQGANSDIVSKKTVYFLHNGIINLIV